MTHFSNEINLIKKAGIQKAEEYDLELPSSIMDPVHLNFLKKRLKQECRQDKINKQILAQLKNLNEWHHQEKKYVTDKGKRIKSVFIAIDKEACNNEV